jgi:hypothetical protein
MPIPSITLEQKLTLILCSASVIGVNPLFFFFTKQPNLMQDMFNIIVYRSSTTFVFLFILIVLDNTRSNRAVDSLVVPKIAFFFIQLVVELVYLFMCEGFEDARMTDATDGVRLVALVKILLNGVVVVWFVGLCFARRVDLDVPETFKFWTYVAIFSVVIGVGLSDRVFKHFVIFSESTWLFALQLATLPSFGLLMVFSHWPSEARGDAVYDAPEDQKGRTVDVLVDLREDHI